MPQPESFCQAINEAVCGNCRLSRLPEAVLSNSIPRGVPPKVAAAAVRLAVSYTDPLALVELRDNAREIMECVDLEELELEPRDPYDTFVMVAVWYLQKLHIVPRSDNTTLAMNGYPVSEEFGDTAQLIDAVRDCVYTRLAGQCPNTVDVQSID